VQPLVARRPLPGAAPTRRLVLRTRVAPVAVPRSDSAHAPIQPANPPRERAAPIPEARALRDTLERPEVPLGAKRTPRGSDPSHARASTAAPAAREERFSLAVVIAAKRLWIEDLGEFPLAREQVELIGAMATALRHPEAVRERPLVTQFDWPMHANEQLDLGPEEAAASLASYLERQAEERGCEAILCLGPKAAERLGRISLGRPQSVLPSTRTLLENPIAKRDAWRILRP